MNRSENDIKLLILLKCSALELCAESPVSYLGNEKNWKSSIRPFLYMMRMICDDNIMSKCSKTTISLLKGHLGIAKGVNGWIFILSCFIHV